MTIKHLHSHKMEPHSNAIRDTVELCDVRTEPGTPPGIMSALFCKDHLHVHDHKVSFDGG